MLSPERAAVLAEIDPDWNPDWPIDWQRHYAGLRALTKAGGTLAEILPGVTWCGEDVGRWLERQRTGWEQLSAGQRERLAGLGVTPAPAPAAALEAGPAGSGKSKREAAWERGLRAARQYRDRVGDLVVARSHIETVTDDDGQEHAVKLGVWLSNQRSRRAGMPQERAAALAELGAWA